MRISDCLAGKVSECWCEMIDCSGLAPPEGLSVKYLFSFGIHQLTITNRDLIVRSSSTLLKMPIKQQNIILKFSSLESAIKC